MTRGREDLLHVTHPYRNLRVAFESLSARAESAAVGRNYSGRSSPKNLRSYLGVVCGKGS